MTHRARCPRGTRSWRHSLPKLGGPAPPIHTGCQREPTVPRTGKWVYQPPGSAAIPPISTAPLSFQGYRTDGTSLQACTHQALDQRALLPVKRCKASPVEVDADCLHANWVRIPREPVLWTRSSPKPSCSPLSLNAGDARTVTPSGAGRVTL